MAQDGDWLRGKILESAFEARLSMFMRGHVPCERGTGQLKYSVQWAQRSSASSQGFVTGVCEHEDGDSWHKSASARLASLPFDEKGGNSVGAVVSGSASMRR